MANEDSKDDAAAKKAIEPIIINHQNLISASNGLLALAQRVKFIDRDGGPDFSALDKDSLSPNQNTLIDYVLAVDMGELIAGTDQLVAALDKQEPHLLTNNVPLTDNASELPAADGQALPQKTLKSILELDSPLGYVEDSGRGGIERHQEEIKIVKRFLEANKEKEAWPVELVKYYQLERRVYNTLQALKTAKQNNNHVETVKQAGLLFSFLHEMREAAQKESAARPPFIMSEKPIATATYAWSDLDEQAQSYFISKNLRGSKNKAKKYSDLTRANGLVIDKQYHKTDNAKVVEKALDDAGIESSVKEFIENYAHQNGINWGGLNWLQFDYLHNDYTIVDRSIKKSFIITPQQDGSVEFRAVYHLTELSDVVKSAESSTGYPVNVNLGQGLILDTTYTISPKKEGEAEASVALKSHTISVLDKKVFDYIPALNPNPQEKSLEESRLAEQPAEAEPKAADEQQEVDAPAKAQPIAADEQSRVNAQEQKPDSKSMQALKFAAAAPFAALFAIAFVATAIAAYVVASPVLIGLTVASGVATLLTSAAKAISNRVQVGKTTASAPEQEVANLGQEAKTPDKPTVEAASTSEDVEIKESTTVINKLLDENQKAIQKQLLMDMLKTLLGSKDEAIDKEADYGLLQDRLAGILGSIDNADKLIAAYDKIPQSNEAMQQFFVEQLQGSQTLKPEVLEQFKTFMREQKDFESIEEKDFNKESSKAPYATPKDANDAAQRNKGSHETHRDVSIPATGPANKM